ncbi:MAG: tripartite tricarboxylate transporter substrate binding protein, partial [Oxalobacteraceae bacterium]
MSGCGINNMNIASMVTTLGLSIVALVAGAPSARAEIYPSRPITWVVPFTPGGLADIGARLIARKLSDNVGQAVIIENKPGAGGIVGAEAVANAKPDGYTFLYGAAAPMAVNVSLHKNLSYDPLMSFEPVHGITMSPLIIATNPSKPYKTFKELIVYAKKHPGKLNFSSPGIGTAHHLAGELISISTDIQMQHVPYKG